MLYRLIATFVVLHSFPHIHRPVKLMSSCNMLSAFTILKTPPDFETITRTMALYYIHLYTVILSNLNMWATRTQNILESVNRDCIIAHILAIGMILNYILRYFGMITSFNINTSSYTSFLLIASRCISFLFGCTSPIRSKNKTIHA